jgi:hypothetical protein
MEWGTEIGTGTISASPPLRGPVQGAASPAPDCSFQATGTAGFVTGAVAPPRNRSVPTASITEACFSYAPLNCTAITAVDRSITFRFDGSHPHRIGGVMVSGTATVPTGQRLPVIWRYGP